MGIHERKQREKIQRCNDILDAAEEVFFPKGMEEATMEEVAEKAELSKGTLYLYFKNKQELYLGITRRGLEILTGMFQDATVRRGKGIAKMEAVGRAYYEFSRKYPDYFQAMVFFDANVTDVDLEEPNAMACAQQGKKVLQICVDALETGIRDGSIRSDIDPHKAAVVLWGQAMGILQLLAVKGKHFAKIYEHFHFENLDVIVDYAFGLMRCSLEPDKSGERK